MYSNRNYVVFNMSEIDKIDFTQVLETSSETLRKSVDGTKSFVKWDSRFTQVNHGAPADDPAAAVGQTLTVSASPGFPSFYDSLETKEGPYTHEEMLTLLSSPEWTSPEPILLV
jgi:hypothetical protein